ncbi:MAG: hypothetical protein QNJ46_20985 [Leptolyngbyaceae cyanobacterium MO_188.B28]|nr:hypothetical protein [Leptolyngbyaceae cyanobacterium MO_188.B28]
MALNILTLQGHNSTRDILALVAILFSQFIKVNGFIAILLSQ